MWNADNKIAGHPMEETLERAADHSSFPLRELLFLAFQIRQTLLGSCSQEEPLAINTAQSSTSGVWRRLHTDTIPQSSCEKVPSGNGSLGTDANVSKLLFFKKAEFCVWGASVTGISDEMARIQVFFNSSIILWVFGGFAVEW